MLNLVELSHSVVGVVSRDRLLLVDSVDSAL
jgi:hypothetical protein